MNSFSAHYRYHLNCVCVCDTNERHFTSLLIASDLIWCWGESKFLLLLLFFFSIFQYFNASIYSIIYVEKQGNSASSFNASLLLKIYLDYDKIIKYDLFMHRFSLFFKLINGDKNGNDGISVCISIGSNR